MREVKRPQAAKRKRESITLEVLQPLFSVPLNRAAESLGVSLTTLKAACRDLGLPSWPHRRLFAGGSTLPVGVPRGPGPDSPVPSPATPSPRPSPLRPALRPTRQPAPP
eukprot:tig00021326_g20313.t1